MSTSKPAGSSFEKVAQKKNNLPILVIILLGVHLVALGGMLWSGCKPQPEDVSEADPPSVLPPLGGGSNAPAESPFFGPIGEAPAPTGVTVPPTTPGTVPPPATVVTQDLLGNAGATTGGAPAAPATTGTPRQPVPPSLPAPLPPPVAPGGAPAITPPSVPTGSSAGPGRVVGTTTPPAAKVHTVGRGDTFYSIASEYGTKMRAIQAANPSVDPRRLRLGQKINVPPAPASASRTPAANDPSIYVVKSGDMLGKIARRYKTSVSRLREINNLPTDRIRVGQKLKLPPESLR